MPGKFAMILVVLLAAGGNPGLPAEPVLAARPVPLPGGAAGIGFDDLFFSPTLKKLVVPAGRSGKLDLVDPSSAQVAAIEGFTSKDQFGGGHGEGTTSADEGRGLIFANDRTSNSLLVVDAGTLSVVARAPLASASDYVRFVEPTGEVWVTEPDKERIEVFSLPATGAPTPSHAAFIPVPGGPESLIIDAGRARAYSNHWKGFTVAIALRERKVVETWPNGCTGSRGLARDAVRGFLFVGCAEGKAVVLGLDKGGAVLDSLEHGSGVDIIAFNPELGHLYLPGARSATMAILGVAPSGRLALLGTVKTATGSHCVATDDRRQAWVCDPDRGQLLRVVDTLAGTGPQVKSQEVSP